MHLSLDRFRFHFDYLRIFIYVVSFHLAGKRYLLIELNAIRQDQAAGVNETCFIYRNSAKQLLPVSLKNLGPILKGAKRLSVFYFIADVAYTFQAHINLCLI